MKDTRDLKDKLILLAWITGLLLLISCLWILTLPLQTNYLLRTVNNVLTDNNDSRRLSVYIAGKGSNPGLFGYWYSMHNSSDLMFVFTVFQNGILVPLGAVVSANGNVLELIPLSEHSVQIFDRLPQSVIQMYVRRIEGSAMEGRQR